MMAAASIDIPDLRKNATCIVTYQHNSTAFGMSNTGEFIISCITTDDKVTKINTGKLVKLADPTFAKLKLIMEIIGR